MRRHAKAPSAAEAMHSDTGRELGSAQLRFTLLALVAALSLALLTAPTAWANGNVDVSVVGSGSGTVTSTSQQIFFGEPSGSGIVTPGQINCSKAGGPVCSASFAHEFPSFATEVKVTLTATADPGGGPFAGWTQADGTSSTRCTTPPQANPTCVLTLNGSPGPSARVFALFGDPPGPPSVATDGSTPGSDFHLATLEGRVNPNGTPLLDCRFLFGTTTEYGQSAPCVPSAGAIGNGTSDVAVTASTEPLEPNTTYHFRLRATGALGAADEGEDMTFTTGSAPTDPCPNADIRAEQGVAAILLPDCMAIEQVSPAKKDNQPARIRFLEATASVNEHVGSISVDGGRVKFRSTAALGETTGTLDPFGDWYVSARDEGSEQWKAFHTNPPTGISKGWYGYGETARPAAFSADLSHWFQIAATPDQFEANLGQVLRGGLGKGSVFLSSLLAPLSGSPNEAGVHVQFVSQGSSADSSHLYFSTEEPLTYLSGDPLPTTSFGGFRNTYVAQLDSNGDPSLELLARDGNGKVWGNSCGAWPGGGHPGFSPKRNRGAISADGSRTYFSTRPSQPSSGNCNNTTNKLRILKRVETAEGPWISELIASECDRVANLPAVPACGTVGPSGTAVPDSDDIYEGASIEGSKVYFTTGRQLADSDTNGLDEFGFSSGCPEPGGFIGPGGCDLYLYDAKKPSGERLTQVTAGSNGQSIPKVVAISGDGSHAYFTSTRVLTATPGPEGKVAQAGQANLYLFEQSAAHPNGHLAFIATTNPGSAYPVPVLGEDPTEIGASGDGHLLVFSSSAALTSDDLDGSKSDVFRYDAEDGTLVRVSKAALGGTDNGPVGVFVGPSLGQANSLGREAVGSPEFVVAGRWVSEDGETITFKTQDGLVPGDGNGVLDSYVYRDGDLYRLPGTGDSSNGVQDEVGVEQGLVDGPLVSTDGDLIAFQSFEQLLARDRDTAIDVYALRVEGGFSEPPEPVICPPDSTGGCQGPAGGPIGEASGASASLVSPGNLKPKAVPRRCPKGKRKVRRKGKVRCVNRKAAKAKKAKSNRNANTDRRAGK